MSYIYRYSKTSPQISSIDYPSIAFLTSNPIVERVKGISGRQGSSSGYAGAYASLTAVFRVSLSAYTRIRTLLVCIALVEASLLFSPLHAKSPLSGAQRGAGVQNRFCGPQCLQRSQRQQSGFLQLLLYFLQKHVLPLWYSLHNHFHRLCSIQYSFIRAFLLSRNMCSLRMNSK